MLESSCKQKKKMMKRGFIQAAKRFTQTTLNYTRSYSSTTTFTQPQSLKDVTVTRLVGQSAKGKKYASYATSFVALHWLTAIGFSAYILLREESTSADEQMTRYIVTENAKQSLLEALSEEDRIHYINNPELIEKQMSKLKPVIDQKVREKLAEKHNAKYMGSGLMITTAMVSTGIVTLFNKRLVSKIVVHSMAMNPQKAESMDLFMHSLNILSTPTPQRVNRFTRLMILDIDKSKPQVVFTPEFPDHSKQIVYYYCKDKVEAQDVYKQLNDSGLLDPLMTGQFNAPPVAPTTTTKETTTTTEK